MKLAAIVLSIGTMVTLDQRDARRANLDRPSAAVSIDGRLIAFTTYSQLVSADSNTSSDAYVLDRSNGRVTLESGSAAGLAGDVTRPGISADGRYVIFERGGVWLRDRVLGSTTMLAPDAWGACVSADANVVLFTADGFGRASEPDVNGNKSDVYAIDLASGHARRISVDMPGLDATTAFSSQPASSSDGRYVAFTSRQQTASGQSGIPYVFVRDTLRNITTRVGPGWDPTLSGDGRHVAFVGMSNRLANIYLGDVEAGTTRIITKNARGGNANGASARPHISADGRFVAFQSMASNLVAADDFNLLWDVFVFDRATSRIMRLSGDAGEPWMEPSGGPSIDGTGSIVAFSSRHPTDASDKKNDFDLYVANILVSSPIDDKKRAAALRTAAPATINP